MIGNHFIKQLLKSQSNDKINILIPLCYKNYNKIVKNVFQVLNLFILT